MIRLNPDEITKLLDYLLDCGIRRDDIVCVFVEGSCLYVTEPSDIDIVCVTKSKPLRAKAPHGYELILQGLSVDANFLSIEQVENFDLVWRHHFYHERYDWVPLFGDPDAVPKPAMTEEMMEKERQSFLSVVFDPNSIDYNPKRLVSFLALAKRFHYPVDRKDFDMAHAGELDPAKYKAVFNALFPKSSPKSSPLKTKSPN